MLYNRTFVEERFSQNAVTRIQDEFVACCSNVIFIEYSDNLRNKIRNYIRKIKSNNTYLILLGNHDMIPFETMPSPVNDGDSIVYTDNYWNCYDRGRLLPEFPLSRIPIPHEYNENSVIAMIERLMSYRTLNHREKLGITASIWDRAARHVFNNILGTGEILLSPPFSVKNNSIIKFSQFNGSVYCNVHGSDRERAWYGQAKKDEIQYERFPVALMPESFKKGFKDAFLVSEACYGGLINDKGIDQSIALSAVCEGLTFTLLSTSTAYGTYFPPISEADLLVEKFYQYIYNGLTAGKALLRAKREFAVENIEKNGFLDNDDRKTLLEFLIYGNPLVREKL